MKQEEEFLKKFEEEKTKVVAEIEKYFPGVQKDNYLRWFRFSEISSLYLDLEQDRSRLYLLSGDLYLRVKSTATLRGVRYNRRWKYTPKNLTIVFQKITQLLNEERIVNAKYEEEREALRNLQDLELENKNINPGVTLRRMDSGKYYLDIRHSLVSLQAALTINNILNQERNGGDV